MVANIRGFTPNYNFKLINFDTPRWHTHEYSNWSQLDAMFLQVGVPGMRGEWQNATLYLQGERVFDAQSSDMYRCLIEHTSASTGTFQADRGAHPQYWVLQTLGVPLYRGDWASGVQYSLGDLVKVNSYQYNLCVVRHVSSLTFSADILFWTFVFDATDTINDANQAASDAQDDATAAGVSAGAAATSATNAATSETHAKTSETNAKTSETNAATSETNAGISEDNAKDSENVSALQANSLRGTSTSTHTIGTGSKTFATQSFKQFNVGNYMTIVATANPTGMVMSGPITAYDLATANVTVNVTGTLGSGSNSDWQLYISGMQGVKGVDGSGGGGIADAVADGKLYGRINNTWQTAVKLTGDTMTGHLSLPTTPAAANAVRKDYVDGAITTAGASTKLPKDGSEPMTGDLLINKATPIIELHKTAAAQGAYVVGYNGSNARWLMAFGNSGAESGSNAGSDFIISNYNDAGAQIGQPLLISRATGLASVTGDPTTPLGIATKQYVDGRAVTAAEYLANSAAAGKYVTATTAWAAAAYTNLGAGATVTPDMSLGIDFLWQPSPVSVTLGNAINMKMGQKGVIYIITQTANTMITWGSNYKFSGGIKPTLSSPAGSIDVLSYVCGANGNAGNVYCTFSVDMK
jgi:hypothetical protein